ncbi:MAG: outer membrane protein assembly factor BamB family protein [Planctomycetales bacterium]
MPRQRNIFIDRVRCSSAIRAMVLCVVATSLVAAMSPGCFAWQAVSSDEPVRANDSALSHSAVPLRNRTVHERLRRAEAMIARRELTTAIAELREAAAAGTGSQILVNESAEQSQEYRDGRSVIESLLLELPADSLNSYRRQAEPLARAQFLKAARDSDFESLRALPSHFPLTDAARDSLRFLAAWHLDRQEFAAADAVARRLAGLSGLSPTHIEAARRIVDLCDVKLAEKRTVRASTEAVSDARRKLPIRAKLFPSLTQPDWQVDSGLNDEAATLTRHALHEHFEQSIPILPRAQPLVVDGVVVLRSLTQVSAHDLGNGQLLWSSESISEAGQSASRLTMNLSLQELMSQKLARGLQVDSLQSRLSTDGERVFTVESGAGVMPDQGSPRSTLLNGSNYQSQTQNRIVARHIRTGKVEWNLTADSILAAIPEVIRNAEDGGKIGDIYFCGLPLPVDRNVLGLVQVGDSLRVYAANRSTGQLDWSFDIAEVPRLSPADSDWRSLDCRVTLVDGVLVCPTGAGLLIGVDLGTRTVIWSRRYSRADTPLEVTRLPFAPARPQRPWWHGWRDNKLLRVTAARSTTHGQNSPPHVDDSILIAAGPDTEGLSAIDPLSGRRLWSLAVESPVDLISNGDCIVILSRHSVSAVDTASGKVIWKAPCREPVGTGYTLSIPTDTGSKTRSTYHVFPVRGGSLLAVNCDDGAMLESVDRLQSLSGCLVSAGDRIVSLNPDRLSTWSMLSAIPDRGSIGDAPEPTPEEEDSIDNAIDRAAFERSCGSFAEATSRLKKLDGSSRVKRQLWKTLLAWIDSRMLSPERISGVVTEAEVLVGESSIAELIELRHAAARAAASAVDPVASLRFYAKLQSLNPSGEPRFLKPEPLRSVRHDRLVQGEVLDLLAGREDAIGARLTQEFSELSQAASESRDPFALQRFTRQWGQLPMVAARNLDDRSRIGMRFGQKLLSLLAVADSSDRDVSFDASGKLAELYKSRSYDRDATAVRRTLQRRGFDVDSLPDAKVAGSPWNSGLVTISEHAEQNLDTTFIPVPVKCSPGTLFDRLNVAINPRSSRNDTILRFYGDGFSGSWQTVLPTSASPLKSVGRMYRGWGIGHLLVLQLGAELFGISPFDGSGEPRVQRLWSVDMANGNRQEDHEYAPAVTGFAEEQLTMLDAFGRPIAKVGPVRAGYLCFQTRGKLVCLDTSTGQRLWQRYELPRQAICSGDGQHIYLTQPREDRVTVLRIVDGATVSKFRFSDAAGFRGTILRVSGSTVLVGERSPDSTKHPGALRISILAAVNLQSASAEWSIDVDPDSTVFAVGPDRLGILQTSGQLQIIDSGSGKEISSLNVERPEQIKAVHVSSDASTHVIALSEIAESAFLNGRSAGGRRNPSVTGQLVVIDSVTARLKWQRPVDRIRFLLEQPKNVPSLVLSYRRSRSSGTEATDSVLHVINRETGEDILNRRGASSASDFTFEPHADQNRLSIRLARKSIRLTFAPRILP